MNEWMDWQKDKVLSRPESVYGTQIIDCLDLWVPQG